MVHQGVCYGMRPSVIKETFPDYYNQWKKNPLTFRFPGGESYMDGVVRAESIVIDLEQTSTPVLIITHVSMMRILYAYFKSIPVDTVTDLNFPQGLVVEFKPSLYGWQEERIDLMQGKRKSVCDDTLNKDINNIPVENEIIYN